MTGMSNIFSSDLLHNERVVFRTDTASRLFPCRVRSAATFDYYGESQLAPSGGGDFFDFIPAESNGLITALGNVSGPNTAAAALLIPGMRNFLRTRPPASDRNINTIVRDLNRNVCDASPDSFYTTLFCAWIDADRRLLRYVNAGNDPALLVRDHGRSIHHLECTGTVLGLTTRAVFGMRTLTLEPGDLLVAFSDGLAEARSASGQVFGESGVLQVVREASDARAVEIVANILDSARRFTARTDQANDRTAAVIRFNEATAQPLLEEEVEEAAFAAA
jgi:sigma-B regulation protein RsbU (phosphoserine phosphatase)